MKTIIKVISGALVTTLILIVCFLVYLFVDMKKVENQAEDCKPISVALENYKKQNNEYPKALDSLGISNELKELCNYNKDKNGYIFALKGSDFNMQFYIYSSEQNAWYWD